jgi:hypothetical protein
MGGGGVISVVFMVGIAILVGVKYIFILTEQHPHTYMGLGLLGIEVDA